MAGSGAPDPTLPLPHHLDLGGLVSTLPGFQGLHVMCMHLVGKAQCHDSICFLRHKLFWSHSFQRIGVRMDPRLVLNHIFDKSSSQKEVSSEAYGAGQGVVQVPPVSGICNRRPDSTLSWKRSEATGEVHSAPSPVSITRVAHASPALPLSGLGQGLLPRASGFSSGSEHDNPSALLSECQGRQRRRGAGLRKTGEAASIPVARGAQCLLPKERKTGSARAAVFVSLN